VITREGYKVLTHDYRPPIQGGPPVWDGKRKTLDKVTLDTGPNSCAPGWHFCAKPEDALRIGGLWPSGRPSVLLHVRGSRDTVERGVKLRCSRLTILGVLDEGEVERAVGRMSEPFGKHAVRMATSQMHWRYALSRPEQDNERVEYSLRTALKHRGLDNWALRHYPTAGAVRDARDWNAWNAWTAGAIWYARDAWAALDAGAAPAAGDAWSAGADGDAWNAWAAWAALTSEYASLAGWHGEPADRLARGLRDAYACGLEAAMPVGPKTLGWAMVETGE
jgi:hypothetical protein